MKVRNVFATLLLSAFLIALPAGSTGAQRRMNAPEPGYDTKTEVTIRGIVEEVQTQMMPPSARGRGPMTGMMGGTHLKMKTDKGITDVRLGPSNYLAEKKFTVAKGDTLEVTGSRVKIDGSDALIAREVKRGNDKLELRDKNGVPLWSGYKSANP